MFKRRTRIVSFRVSEEEYQDLVQACVANGARSVSDFARDVTRQSYAPGTESHKPAIELQMENLRKELDSLQREFRRLAEPHSNS